MTAYSSFGDGTVEVKLLLELCSLTVAEGESPIERDNAVRRASVVLMVSHFESYLKGLAEEFVDVIGSGQLESRQIPRGIRELHTLPRIGEILGSKDDDQRAALLKKLPEMSALWNDSSKPPPGTLDPRLVRRQVTNADSRTIDNLFVLMGNTLQVCDGDIDVPTSDDGESIPVNIRLGLADVVKCRNDIAHGDIGRKPTSEDLDRYLAFLVSLAERLQKKADALAELYAS